jgi:archaeal cell division control protein 6
MQKMSDRKQLQKNHLITGNDVTEELIRKIHLARKNKAILVNPDYLDDEKLPEDERSKVLNEIFNRNIREKQLSRIISHLTPILDKACPPSALVYGPTGSGKTVSLIHVLSTFYTVAQSHNIVFNYRYIDLTSPKSFFAALNEMAISLECTTKKYRKGIPIEYMQEKIIDAISGMKGYLCFLIDEADNIKPNPDLFLTFLAKTLPRKVSCRLLYILITNRLDWEKTLDSRILSFFKKTDIIFEPYDAMDLLEILKLRSQKALDQQKVDQAALNKISAYASQETGDARMAVELLSKSVKVAEETTGYLGTNEVDMAEKRLEVDKTTELINTLAIHQKLALQSCYYHLNKPGVKKVTTGQAYEVYQKLCNQRQNRFLSQRRFCDIISFLDLYGLINARVISMGRYGKTREIISSLPEQIIDKIT